jgi:hypothetical protein
VPSDRGAALRARRERRSLAIAAATAAAVERDFDGARNLARRNLEQAASVVGDNQGQWWIAQWREAITRGPKAVRNVLLDPSDHGHDMRQMAPFAGLLTEEERAAALAAVDALAALQEAP